MRVKADGRASVLSVSKRGQVYALKKHELKVSKAAAAEEITHLCFRRNPPGASFEFASFRALNKLPTPAVKTKEKSSWTLFEVFRGLAGRGRPGLRGRGGDSLQTIYLSTL